jgi:phosphoribosylformylglycinamidine cyclo-ligase
MGTTYADSGVNIELGDDASKVLYNAAKLTWENRKGRFGEVVELFEDFSGLRAIDVGGLPKGTFMNLGFDGVGTKMELGERIGKHDTVAFDLFAMVCDDAVVRGAEPVLIGSILDVNSLGKEGSSHINFVKQLAKGYIAAAKAANVAVVNGEVAELGARVQGYGDFSYNWGAGIAWFAKRDRMFSGHEVKIGDYVVGLREEGFRSNGLSLVRRIMNKSYGDKWHEKEFDGRNLAELALTPSKIYSAAIVDMFGGFEGEPKAELHGVAHITGGGIPGKLGRVLKPSGLGAVLDDPFEPSAFVSHVQQLGGVADKEAYKTWNMGQGMLVVTPESSINKVVEVAQKYGIEAKKVGYISQSPEIRIRNRGIYTNHEPVLVFG